MSIVLTADQQNAYSEIVNLLTTPRKELVINGFAGTGKTTLVNTFLEEWPQFVALSGGTYKELDVYLTATTNKAAGVIGGETIFALLGLTIFNDYKTGDVCISQKNAKHKYNSLIIVDESSMVDAKILKVIRELCKDCKILYVGDKYQLNPVGLTYSPIFDSDIPSVEMTTQNRQDENSYLFTVIQQIREWVRTGVKPKLVAGDNVTFINDIGLKEFVTNPGFNDKILTYTNDSCIDLNQYVRYARGLPMEFYSEGATVMSNTTDTSSKAKSKRIYTDKEYTITDIGTEQNYKDLLTYRECCLNGHPVRIPTCPRTFKNLLNKFKSQKNWSKYFGIKESFIEVRDAYAVTTHKSQGSTYDRVLINLTNFKRCPDKLMRARLLYVAISRTKTEVFLYGEL